MAALRPEIDKVRVPVPRAAVNALERSALPVVVAKATVPEVTPS